jgi:hypothetical protein
MRASEPRALARSAHSAIRRETDVGAFCNRFYAKTLEEALAWCLVWLIAPELGIGPFRV